MIPEEIRTMSWSGEMLCVGFKKQYLLINPQNGQSKLLFSSSSTLTFTLPSNEILLSKDNGGIVIDFEGKPTKRFGINWSDLPTCLGVLHPYIISPVKDILEIRMIRASKNGTLVQSINLPGIITLSQENYIDMDNQKVHSLREKMRPINNEDEFDYKKRIIVAAKHKIYILCLKHIHLQIDQLQKLRQFEDALTLSQELVGTEYEIEKWRMENIHLEYAFYLFKIGEFRQAMNNFLATTIDPRMVISLIPNLLIDDSKYAHKDKAEIFKLLEDETQKQKALSALIPYLTGCRIPIGKQTLTKEETEIGEAVDTALLKCYLTSNQNLVQTFLRIPNRCSIEITEEALKQTKKYTELILFYKSKGMHKIALDLLKKLSEEDILKGLRPTIDYLLGIDDKELILEYSKWVLIKDPTEGLEIFDRDNIAFSNNEILKFIETVSPNSNSESLNMKIAFLEKIIKGSKDPELHNLLIISYQHLIKLNEIEQKDQPQIRTKLRTFLKQSKHYIAIKFMNKFTGDEFNEERAILLSRINKHQEALNIYVQNIKRIDLAEKHCEEYYGTNEESKDVFLILVQILLQQPEPNIKDAIRILETHSEKINPMSVLKYLPNNILLTHLKGYFEFVLRTLNEKRRQIQVMKNLSKTDNIQVLEDWVNERRKVLSVKPNRMCPVCHKNIGTKVFYWYPNGIVVHVICAKDTNVCPVTGVNFLKEYNLKHGIYTPPKQE